MGVMSLSVQLVLVHQPAARCTIIFSTEILPVHRFPLKQKKYSTETLQDQFISRKHIYGVGFVSHNQAIPTRWLRPMSYLFTELEKHNWHAQILYAPQYTAPSPSSGSRMTVVNVTCFLMCKAEMTAAHTCTHILAFLCCLLQQIS